MTRSRRSATVAASVLTVWLASGCAVFSNQTTGIEYTPSDGAQADVGQLAVRNLLFVAEDAESAGNLVGAFLNNGSEDMQVTLSSENGVQESFEVPAGGRVSVGPQDAEEGEQPSNDVTEERVAIQVDPVDVVPGRTIAVTVDNGDESLDVVTPVVDTALSEYADLAPTTAGDS